MHINKDKHLISNLICVIALLHMLGMAANFVVRFLMVHGNVVGPDMMDAAISKGQGITTVFLLFFMSIAFCYTYRKIKHYERLISPEEEEELAALQKEFMPDKVSTLSFTMIRHLLYLWAAILLGVQAVYEITSFAYKGMIESLVSIEETQGGAAQDAFLSLYNTSHGFKYEGMLLAISIGIFTTGLFLKDKVMLYISAGLVGCFLVAFLLFQQSTIHFGGRAIGVVWTSVLFHGLETIGLLLMGVYMRSKYRGM